MNADKRRIVSGNISHHKSNEIFRFVRRLEAKKSECPKWRWQASLGDLRGFHEAKIISRRCRQALFENHVVGGASTPISTGRYESKCRLPGNFVDNRIPPAIFAD